MDKKKIPGQLLEELRDNKYDLILLPYSLYGSTTYKNLLRIADQIKPLHILQYHDHGPEKLKNNNGAKDSFMDPIRDFYTSSNSGISNHPY